MIANLCRAHAFEGFQAAESRGEEQESILVKELEIAYSIILTINTLDLTKDGETTWYSLRNEYNKKTEKIES